MAEQRSSSSSSSNGKKQRGGTFLSFVGGVVVGLGVALAVAMYVSKVPIPFLNKNQPRNAEQDAAEVLKNKDWDPNAALYGKSGVTATEMVDARRTVRVMANVATSITKAVMMWTSGSAPTVPSSG